MLLYVRFALRIMQSLGTYSSHVDKSGKSFRTTIPLPVSKALALDHRVEIVWELKIDQQSRLCAVVTKAATDLTKKARKLRTQKSIFVRTQ